MKRLTTNKPLSEMNMVELAYNCCYTKDGMARYRDFETDIDAIELARHLMLSYRLWEENDTATHDDDALNDELVENLAYGPMEIDGLIAMFYRSILAMSDLREWLKEYEDAEEQGLLVRLPCKVGDKAYHVIYDCIANPSAYIHEYEIKDVSQKAVYFADDWWRLEEMKSMNAYLSKEEAEAALKVMVANNGGINNRHTKT